MQIQLTGSTLDVDELSLTLWHCGRVRVDELMIVTVVDGVLEMEIPMWVARVRSDQSDLDAGFTLGKGWSRAKGATWDCNRDT